jgi:hypothetical protein
MTHGVPIILGADSEPETIPYTTRLGVSRATAKQRTERPHNSHRWRKVRKMSATTEPLCRLCKQAMSTVDHIDGNPKNQRAFNLQSLCTICHGWKTNAFEKRSIYLQAMETPTDLRFYLDKLHNRRTYDTFDDDGYEYRFFYPQYLVYPQPFVSDTQFMATLFASHLYAMRLQEMNYDSGMLPLWYNHATPVVNDARGQLKTKNQSIVDEFMDGASNDVTHIYPQAGCTFAEILRIVCVMHTYEHFKQGA